MNKPSNDGYPMTTGCSQKSAPLNQANSDGSESEPETLLQAAWVNLKWWLKTGAYVVGLALALGLVLGGWNF